MTRGELRRLAEAATPGPWDTEDTHDACCGSPCTPNGCHESHPSGVYHVYFADQDEALGHALGDGYEYARIRGADAEFIAAFNPATALALLDRLDRLEARVREYAEAAAAWSPDARERVLALLEES